MGRVSLVDQFLKLTRCSSYIISALPRQGRCREFESRRPLSPRIRGATARHGPLPAASRWICQTQRTKADSMAMHYVYILESLAVLGHFYIGTTENFRERIRKHHADVSGHAAKYRPWKLKTYVALDAKGK